MKRTDDDDDDDDVRPLAQANFYRVALALKRLDTPVLDHSSWRESIIYQLENENNEMELVVFVVVVCC